MAASVIIGWACGARLAVAAGHGNGGWHRRRTNGIPRPSEREGELDLIRHQLDSLLTEVPYVEWGRWFLADRATQPIAPGFSILPAGAE